MAHISTCCECGQRREHEALGLCKPCYNRHYHWTHKEEINARSRQWYKNHRGEANARRKCWNESHREQQRAYNHSWHERHGIEANIRNRRWRIANPGRVLARKARRRARRRAAPDTLTPSQAEQLIGIGRSLYPGQKLHLDHIVPLSKGGGTTLANMHAIPARLNMSKHDKLPEEVYEQEPFTWRT